MNVVRSRLCVLPATFFIILINKQEWCKIEVACHPPQVKTKQDIKHRLTLLPVDSVTVAFGLFCGYAGFQFQKAEVQLTEKLLPLYLRMVRKKS